MNLIKRLIKDEEGQGMVEYALIIALVGLVVAALIPGVTTAIGNLFTRIANALAAPAAGGGA